MKYVVVSAIERSHPKGVTLKMRRLKLRSVVHQALALRLRSVREIVGLNQHHPTPSLLFIYLFICGLFKDTLCTSDCIASNDKVII
jgi:hypothetical protein